MPHMTFLGHHLHSRLIVMPAGLSPFSLVLDLLHMATRNYPLTTIDGDEEV
jgi:hypothetical protein